MFRHQLNSQHKPYQITDFNTQQYHRINLLRLVDLLLDSLLILCSACSSNFQKVNKHNSFTPYLSTHHHSSHKQKDPKPFKKSAKFYRPPLGTVQEPARGFHRRREEEVEVGRCSKLVLISIELSGTDLPLGSAVVTTRSRGRNWWFGVFVAGLELGLSGVFI